MKNHENYIDVSSTTGASSTTGTSGTIGTTGTSGTPGTAGTAGTAMKNQQYTSGILLVLHVYWY